MKNEKTIPLHPDYGVPTASMVEDPAYREALEADRLTRAMGHRSYPNVATVELHNHVNSAVRQADLPAYRRPNPERLYKKGRFGILLDLPTVNRRKVANMLDPQAVQQFQLETIDNFMDVFTEAEPYMNKQQTGIACSGRYYKNHPEGVEEERLDSTGQWNYHYVPWDVIKQDVPAFRDAVATALRGRSDPIKQIHTLWTVLDEFQEHAELLGHDTPQAERSTRDFEHDKRTKAGRLAGQHRTMRGDVYISFDEQHLHVHGVDGESVSGGVEGLVKPEAGHTSFALWTRIAARQRILEAINIKGGLRMHDSTIKRFGTYLVADKEPRPWMLNLLGEPVKVGDQTFYPDDWIQEEKAAVEEFWKLAPSQVRSDPTHPAITKIAGMYDGFAYDRTALRDYSEQDTAEQIAYTLARQVKARVLIEARGLYY